MYRIYGIWEAYTRFVFEAVMAYCECTQDLPDVVAMGVLILPVFAVILFFPHWVALPIAIAIGLPMMWFLGVMFRVFCTDDIGRQLR